jgi:hypothetical protein
MLFTPMMFVAAGTTVALAFVDKLAEGYGFQWLGIVLRLAIPLLAFACGIYFIETNVMLRWL